MLVYQLAHVPEGAVKSEEPKGVLRPRLVNVNQQLLEAVKKGDIKSVEAALKNGADVNARTNGLPILFHAVWRYDAAMIKLLLDNNVNVNAVDESGMSALMHVSFDGSREIAQLLISKGALVNTSSSSGFTALMCAAGNSHFEYMLFLLKNGARADKKNRYGASAADIIRESLKKGEYQGQTKVQVANILRILDDRERKEALVDKQLLGAAKKGDAEGVIYALEKGADVNARDGKGNTALMYASFDGSRELAKLLISKGADVNARDELGITTLMCAAETGQLGQMLFLIRHGARVSPKTTEGLTVIDILEKRLSETSSAKVTGHINNVLRILRNQEKKEAEATRNMLSAAFGGNLEGVETALRNGADLNGLNRDGENVLILACRASNRNNDLIKFLVFSNISVNIQDNTGWTALMYIGFDGIEDMARLLLENGANPTLRTKVLNQTAADMARSEGHTKLAALLKKYKR